MIENIEQLRLESRDLSHAERTAKSWNFIHAEKKFSKQRKAVEARIKKAEAKALGESMPHGSYMLR